MTEEIPSITVQDVPDPIEDLRKILNEQQAVIVKQNEAIKALTQRMNEADKLAAAAPAQLAQAAPSVPEKSPQDAAYEAMLREMGIKEE